MTIGIVVIVLVLGGWFFFARESGEVDSQTEIDSSAQEVVEVNAEDVSNEIDALETEEEQVDAALDEIDELSF